MTDPDRAMAARSARAANTPAESAATVTQLELALLHPANRANPDFVRSVLHPDFCEFGSSGRVWDVDSITAALALDPSADPDAATDFAAIHLSPDAILLTYRTANALRSSTWVREPAGRWRVRFHQGTPASRTLGDGPAGTV